MNRTTIRRNITTITILLYILMYCGVVLLKPSFLYNPDGSLRQFGVGYKSKTILPLWLIAVILAVISYYCVLYYIAIPKLSRK